MKVCFVLENFYPQIGGAETLFKEYTARLAEQGCQVKVVTSNAGGINGRVFYEGVEVNHFPWRGFFGHPIPNPIHLRKFVEWSDLVHTATLTAAPVALSVARKFHKPCLVTIFEVWDHKWSWIERNFLKATLYRLFERYTVSRDYSHYHAISKSTEKDLIKFGIEPRLITAIYPGVKKRNVSDGPDDPQVQLDAKESTRTFLYFGRPGKPKGIFVLLEAIRTIRNKLPEGFEFVYIVSNSPLSEKNRLRRLVKQYALEDLVSVKDPLPEQDLVRAIKRAYCIVVPSITEGFGLSAAESCMMGKPVIVSDAGSLPEVASGKVLFFKNRSSEDLAAKILLATADKFQSVPERVFDWDTSTQRLLDLYKKLSDNRQQ